MDIYSGDLISAASDYLENAILAHLFGKTTLASPASFYLALATALITDSMSGATIPEANYTSYTRLLSLPADWATPAAGLINNSVQLNFPVNTGSTQIITDLCIVLTGPARLTAGNIFFKQPLDSPITVNNGENVRFPIGTINWTAA